MGIERRLQEGERWRESRARASKGGVAAPVYGPKACVRKSLEVRVVSVSRVSYSGL